MQTLQATSAKMQLRIIAFSELDYPTTYRIVDQEGTLIAKINGKANVPIAEDFIQAFNKCEKMKSLLRFRLIEILKGLTGSGLVFLSIREALKNGEIDSMIAALKDQAKTNPVQLTGFIGGEAIQIVELL